MIFFRYFPRYLKKVSDTFRYDTDTILLVTGQNRIQAYTGEKGPLNEAIVESTLEIFWGSKVVVSYAQQSHSLCFSVYAPFLISTRGDCPKLYSFPKSWNLPEQFLFDHRTVIGPTSVAKGQSWMMAYNDLRSYIGRSIL